MATYRVDLEYEGTRYHGWQIQASARSIAGELTRAVRAAGGGPVDLGGSGRTDAGVHALRQSAHLRLVEPVEEERFRREVNEALPHDIHVLGLRRAQDGFHARHDAVSRSYLYQIAQRRTALAKRFVWWVKRPLAIGPMAAAAAAIQGRHDFRHFCERPSEQQSTLVEVQRAQVVREGDLLLVRLVASHFLWKMVRRLVGALVEVGAGEASPEDLALLIEAPRDGAPAPVAGSTAPPSGLFLERVMYPGEPPPGPLAPAVAVAPAGLDNATFLGAPEGRPPHRPRRAQAPRPRRGRRGRPGERSSRPGRRRGGRGR